MAMKQSAIKTQSNEFIVELRDFHLGFSPLANIDSLTQKGNSGHASTMTDVYVLDGNVTQGPGLVNLTNGTQAGAVTETINFILDIPTSGNIAYAIGDTRLFQLRPDEVINDSFFPHTITKCSEGSSIAYLQGNIFYLYNKDADGDIGKGVPVTNTGNLSAGGIDGVNWTNAGNAYSSDNVYATTSSAGLIQTYKTFGLGSSPTQDIAADAYIDGIEVKVEGKGDAADMEIAVRLSWDNGSTWTSPWKVDTPNNGSDTTITFGGPTELWDHDWLATECTDDYFQVQIQCDNLGSGTTYSLDHLQIKIYYTGSEITLDDDWGSTVPTGKAEIQKADHPVACKEDIMLFGNGRYVGTYIYDTDTLAPTKLDFGIGTNVADVVFNANYWYIAVNSGAAGTNRTMGQIFIYDGGATETILSDETGVGLQRIGFLYVLDGAVYVAYQDLSSTGGYNIGYILGRQIKKLASFTGSLPNFQQKTLYQHTILLVSSGSIWTCGAISPEFPVQISQIADGGYATVGALAAPFGTPMVSSTDGGTNFRLAKFSGYNITGVWKGLIVPVTAPRLKGYIDSVMVLTNELGANARCDLTIEADQASRTSNVKQITTTGKVRHIFDTFGLGDMYDFRIALSFANGNTTNPCKIRNILIRGHRTEQA